MMDHAYFDCSDFDGLDPRASDYEVPLRGLVPPVAADAAVEAVRGAYLAAGRDNPPTLGQVLYGHVLAALELNSVEAHVIDEELDNGYILVVRY